MLQVCLSTEWTQLVLLLFARRQVTSTLHEVRDKTNTFKSYKRPTWQAIVLNYIKTYRQFPSIFLCFSSCIFLCAVANSSCKFQLQILFTLGEAFAGAKTSKQILIRCQVSMIDELANVFPNGNRICNWNLQLECDCRKLHRRICNWKNTRSGSPCENGSVPLQQNCALMRALRIQCYKSVWVLNELNLFCCFLLADKWQVLFMRYETKPTPSSHTKGPHDKPLSSTT